MLIALYAICSEIFMYGIYVKLQSLLEHRKHKEWLYFVGVRGYKCRECQKTYKSGDMRVKYSLDKKMKVLSMYLEVVGIRSIERLEKVSSPLIIKWIRKFSKLLKQRLNEVTIPENAKQISIVELDELFSYCQKKLTKSTFGLLLIGKEIKLLILK